MAESGFNPFNLITAGLILYLIYVLIFSGAAFAAFFVNLPDIVWIGIVIFVLFLLIRRK